MTEPVKLLDPRITALPYVNMYGSLCSMHTIRTAEGASFDVPLTRDANITECLHKSSYVNLFPSDRYASTFMILKDGDLEIEVPSISPRRQGIRQFIQSYKLIGWYNCNKLGIASNDYSREIADDLIKNVFTAKIDSNGLSNPRVTVNRISDEVPSEFGKYAKYLNKSWDIFPYGWVTVFFTMNYHKSCIEDVTVGNAVSECLNFADI